MLEQHIAALRCPHCKSSLQQQGGALRCSRGHGFDIARQGYVNLVPGGPPGDSAAMVAARMAVQETGFFAPLAEAVVEQVRARAPRARLVVDLGSGPGYYAAAVASDGRCCLCVDSSKHAARRAARAGSGVAAVVADSAAELPIADASADVVLDVFAPRQPTEFRRIASTGALLLVVIPAPGHLAALRRRVPMLDIETGKWSRLLATLEPHFTLEDRVPLRWRRALDRGQLRDLVLMGPSAFHTDGAELDQHLSTMANTLEVEGEVELAAFRPR